MGFEQEFIQKRLIWYGLPHYLFILIYFIVVCKYHASASQNLQTSKPCTFYSKCFFNLLCLLVYFYLTIYELTYDHFHSFLHLLNILFALAWAFSIHLLYFIYDRALPLTWPHRFFWMLNFFVVFVVFTIELVEYYDKKSTVNSIIGTPSFLVSMSLLLVSLLSLMLISFVSPRDFHSYYQPPPNIPQEPFIASEDISARIFKQSVTAGDLAVLFHIRIFTRGHPEKKAIKRTLPDFQALDEALHFKYADAIKQGELYLPEMPHSFPQTFSQLPELESTLNNYLTEVLSSQNMLTRQILQFLGFSDSVINRTLIHYNEKSHNPILRSSDPRQFNAQKGSSPFEESSSQQASSVSNLRQLLRMIWEREEIILVEVSNGSLEPSHHRIVYPLRLSFAPSLSARYSTAFQTEVTLVEMQRLDKFLKKNRPYLTYLPLPEQDLVYTSGGPGFTTPSTISVRSQIDLRYISRSREQIEFYLLTAFNDPAYYCSALFDLIQKFQALSFLRVLQSLFDGKTAMLENGRLLLIQAEQSELSRSKVAVSSKSYTNKQRKLRTTLVELTRRDLYNPLLDSRSSTSTRHKSEMFVGRYEPRVRLAACTGEMADSMDGDESKELDQSNEVEAPPQIWWNQKLETDFFKLVGLSFRATLQNSEVKLTRDRQFQILFTLKIERIEVNLTAPKNTWIIFRSNNQFIEFDKLLSKRFQPDYQLLFEKQDYLSELKVHWHEASQSINAQRLLQRYLQDLVKLNGLFNSLIVRRFLAMEEGFPRLQQEGRSQTLDDYFDMQSVATSELESHHESLLHSPEQAIITPDYFH